MVVTSSGPVYGGTYPWTGKRYKIEIIGGARLLRWINEAMALAIDKEFVFCDDGSCATKKQKLLTVGKTKPCWRWDPNSGRLLIDFLRNGTELEWRWDEMKTDGDLNSLVYQWCGTAHVGQNTYSYTLTLCDKVAPPGGLMTESVFVERGSFTSNDSVSIDGSPLEERDGVKNMVNNYRNDMAHEKTNIGNILAIIDRMWLQELVLQSKAEMCSEVIEGAATVERGLDPQELFRNTLDRVQNVKKLAFDSLKVRAQARDSVALDGGVDGMRDTLAVQLDEFERSIRPIVDQLRVPMQAGQARKRAKTMLKNVISEFEEVCSLKEAKSQTFVLMQESLDSLQDREASSLETVLQVARANPRNACLQKTFLDTVIFREYHENLDDCVSFLLETMRAHQGNSELQDTCCKAVEHLAKNFPRCIEKLIGQDIVKLILNISFSSDSADDAQASAISALLTLIQSKDDHQASDLLLSNTVEAIHDAMRRYGAQAESQKIGQNLLDVFQSAEFTQVDHDDMQQFHSIDALDPLLDEA